MKLLLSIIILAAAVTGCIENRPGYPYQDPSRPVEMRVKDLMSRMSVEEKVDQLRSDFRGMLPEADYAAGNARGAVGPDPAAFAMAINEDTRLSVSANRWGIPALQHSEALHGVTAGDFFTSFPQSIAVAATFDTLSCSRMASAIAEELKAVGIRQNLSPVVNISRDPRWGRTEETYGEDPFLSSRMGVSYVKAMESAGVVSTPKHFVDNYGDGGRDSYASNTSWRTLREIYLEPFRACIQEGGARSIMAAYNSVDGVPCSMNRKLLQDILRDEWGFEGFVVSDYNSVPGVAVSHRMTDDTRLAQAMCCKSGCDVELHLGYHDLYGQYIEGNITEKQIDDAVRRVLRCKFELGLFERPYADPAEADSVINSPEHKRIALDVARKSMVLLKNDGGVLPLDRRKLKRVAVAGPGADQVSLGGYSRAVNGKDETPRQALERILGPDTDIFSPSLSEIRTGRLRDADAILYFATINESEGGDRSSLGLPSGTIDKPVSLEYAAIVDAKQSNDIKIDQEQMILDLSATGKPLIVILQNGGAVDMREWLDSADAVIESWYCGEKGARAIVETLIGTNNPGGRLPFTWVKHVGQIPLYYNYKPSGRGYSYNDDDGKPLFPFGFGLSYTTYKYSNLKVDKAQFTADDELTFTVDVTNTGSVAGKESVLLYSKDLVASSTPDNIRLRNFEKVSLNPGETKTVTMKLKGSDLAFVNYYGKWTLEKGDFKVKCGDQWIDLQCTQTKVWDTPNR